MAQLRRDGAAFALSDVSFILTAYARVGLERLGPRITSGAVTFDLMAADLRHLRTRAGAIDAALTRLEARVDWQMGVSFRPGTRRVGRADAPPAVRAEDIAADALRRDASRDRAR